MIYYKFLRLESIYYFCEIDYVFKTEQWKPIIGYEGLYEISDLGRVRRIEKKIWSVMNNSFSIFKEKIFKQCVGSTGRLHVSLTLNKKTRTLKIHKIVSICFLDHTPCGYDLVVDHINSNPLDNRKINLQLITARQNMHKRNYGKSKYVGITQSKQKKWKAGINIDGKKIHLGTFETEIEAYEAYKKALYEYKGEYVQYLKDRNHV